MTDIMIQYAALAFRLDMGQFRLLLITSRETHRWILPKGKRDKKKRSFEIAAQEAFEEGGVLGLISTKTVGSFDSHKRLRSGRDVPTRVRVYLLAVTQELDDWPEKAERQRRWLSPEEAMSLVKEPGLLAFLQSVSSMWRRAEQTETIEIDATGCGA